MILYNNNTIALEAWSSPTGAVWTQQGGEGPQAPGWPGGEAAVWDGANTVTVVYRNAAGTHVPLVQFSLSTQTWGASAGDLGSNASPFQLFIDSNGHFVALYSLYPSDKYETQTWNGASWSAAVDICAGAEALPNFNPVVTFFSVGTAALDSNNVLHVIFNTHSSDPTWDSRFFYQEVTSAGALQNFQEFPGQSGVNKDLHTLSQAQIAPTLIISGNSLYWGILRNNYGANQNPYPAIYVGTPIVNPVWTETGNIDPGVLSFQTPSNYPVLASIGGALYATFTRENQSDSGTQIQTVSTSNGFATSVSTTLTDTATGGPFTTGSNPMLLAGLVIGADGYAVEGQLPPVSFASAPAPPPGPTTFGVKITLRGVNRRRCDPQDSELTEIEGTPPVKQAV